MFRWRASVALFYAALFFFLRVQLRGEREREKELPPLLFISMAFYIDEPTLTEGKFQAFFFLLLLFLSQEGRDYESVVEMITRLVSKV